jgi:8-oxo-dGTP pyrophosphatase MutT (NUDIX family)
MLRGPAEAPEVLLGKRRENARFMPGVYVYPGGAVDASDIALEADPDWPGGRFHAAAIRETWEETGVMIAEPGERPASVPGDPCLDAMAAETLRPAGSALHFIARAITPPPSPIRFDTRFFLTGAESLYGTARAIGELPEVAWVPAAQALASERVRGVTKFVLGEALSLWQHRGRLSDPDRPIRLYSYVDGARLISREPQQAGLTPIG